MFITGSSAATSSFDNYNASVALTLFYSGVVIAAAPFTESARGAVSLLAGTFGPSAILPAAPISESGDGSISLQSFTTVTAATAGTITEPANAQIALPMFLSAVQSS